MCVRIFLSTCLHPTGRFFGHKGLTRLFILVFLTKSATRYKCIRIIWLSRLTASTISRSVVAGHFTDHLGSHSWDFVDIPLINFYRASSRENNPRWLAQSHDPQTKRESRYASPAFRSFSPALPPIHEIPRVAPAPGRFTQYEL